jgi:hypothetical protein
MNLKLEVGDRIYNHRLRISETVNRIDEDRNEIYLGKDPDRARRSLSLLIIQLSNEPNWLTHYSKKTRDKIELWKKLK